MSDERELDAELAKPGTALEPAPPARDVLRPLEADDVVASMRAYQDLLPRLLDDNDYQADNRGRRYPTKSAWRKIARAFNLSVTIVDVTVERDGDGNPLRAECIARALAPNGVMQDGDGYCSVDEERFKDERGRIKVENDLRATATTRAKNRAIADLVGMGEQSAEERAAGGDALEVADEALEAEAKRALGFLLEDSEVARDQWARAYRAHGGRVPAGFCRVLIEIRGVQEGSSS